MYRIPTKNNEDEESAVTELKLNAIDRAIGLSLIVVLGALIWSVRTEPHSTVVEAHNEITVPSTDRVERTEHGEFDTDTGEFIRYPDGTGMEEDFRRDCTSVCTYQRHHFASEPETEPGRVLYMDPAHMICACFRPDGFGDGVHRYIGWRHQLR